MALMDLNKELSRQPPAVVVDPSTSSSATRGVQERAFIQDEPTEKLLCDEVVKLLNDPISEVKNVAVSWYAKWRKGRLTRAYLLQCRGSMPTTTTSDHQDNSR